VSDFLTDRTVIGIGTTLVSVGIALWRRIRPSSGPSWFVRLARMGSAITRLQVAEGSLDSVKESLLLEREEATYLRQRVRELQAEVDAIRSGSPPPTSSATTPPSGPSNAGSTRSRGVRSRRKPTT
jgi:hypothetical protein